ncbi:MAG: extracellular solute-binding protein [Thermomicrobiales bacterium]|nr:extracellular solute-binding protein [Thermomicrobiales bacterium]
MTRRQIVRLGAALGLSAAAVGKVLAMPAFAQDSTASPAADGPVMVSLLDQEMTFDEIKAAIAAEGEVNVGNWTYTASDQLVQRFQQYILDVYGEEIKLNYAQSQSPSTYLTELYTAVGSGNSSPYDVLAIEENYYAEVQAQAAAEGVTLLEDFLPSGLIPNAERVFDNFKKGSSAVGFQASASPAVVYNRDKVDFLTDWDDLADERLSGKLLMWLPGDITGGGVLLGVAAALGLDYKDPAQMEEAIAFLVEEVHPNVLKYTADFGEAQQLFQNEVVDVVTFWNSLARLQYLNGQENAAMLVAESGQYAVNGYMFVPVDPPHPVLAQLFIDWRLSDDAQFPDLESWDISEGAWAELQEGFMGESYQDLVPDWIADAYFDFYPTIEQLETQYLGVDWDYYTQHSGEWYDKWLQGIGL